MWHNASVAHDDGIPYPRKGRRCYSCPHGLGRLPRHTTYDFLWVVCGQTVSMEDGDHASFCLEVDVARSKARIALQTLHTTTLAHYFSKRSQHEVCNHRHPYRLRRCLRPSSGGQDHHCHPCLRGRAWRSATIGFLRSSWPS